MEGSLLAFTPGPVPVSCPFSLQGKAWSCSGLSPGRPGKRDTRGPGEPPTPHPGKKWSWMDAAKVNCTVTH